LRNAVTNENNPDLKSKSNQELFDLYATRLKLSLRSSKSIKEAKRILGHFQVYLADRTPSTQLAEAFLAQFSSRKSTTLYRYHSIINGFMKWYGQPLETRIRVPDTLPPYIESSDVEKLRNVLRTARTTKAIKERNLLIVDLMADAGLRRGEVANLKVRDINFDLEQLAVRGGKGQKDRYIELTQSLKASLHRHLEGKDSEDNVIGLDAESISDIITRHAKKAGVDIHAHSLRDYFTTRLVDLGVDLETIRRLLGHKSLNTTQRYVARTDAQRREAIQRLDAPTPNELLTEQSVPEQKTLDTDPLRAERIRVHQKSMQQLVDQWSQTLHPQMWRYPIRELGEPGLHRYAGDPPLYWLVAEQRQIDLCLPLEVSTDQKTIIARDYLWRHLETSKMSWVLDDTERGLPGWKNVGGLELAKRTELLKSIDRSCREITGIPPSDKSITEGTTLSFSDTILTSVIDGVYRDLLYSYDQDQETGRHIAKYGGFNIALSVNRADAERYVKCHQELISKWKVDPLSLEIAELIRTREQITQQLEKQLVKIIVDRHVPGICEECPI